MKTGVVVGTFDLFHIGHLNLLNRARLECDRLIVGVNRDAVVLRDKNVETSIKEDDRLEIIKSLYVVDDAFLVDDNAVQFIRDTLAKGIPLNCYFRGAEPEKLHILVENEKIRAMGVDVVQFPYTDRVSSTLLRCKLVKKSDSSVTLNCELKKEAGIDDKTEN
ncbi:MAG: adenylyltransferase/cytidyltransferase family protein [Alphaproteobacteria bacterium]|nr:adenylyltransferase/cytidyltransferase family protein [Alphaproteobacteria bacterium]